MRQISLIFSLIAVITSVAIAAKKPREPDVLIVSDVLAGKDAITRPTKEAPIHYMLLGGVERDLGQSIAGEPMPSKEQIEASLEKVLTTQNFIRSHIGDAMPAIAIVYSYGTANPIIDEYEQTDLETGETTVDSTYFNRREIEALTGIDKARNGSLMSSTDAYELNDAAQQDRVYLFVAAVDVEAIRKKERKLLWRTRMSIESLRHSLPDSLDLMLASAAPFFGIETKMPVFMDERDRRKVEVEIGETTVVEDTPKP